MKPETNNPNNPLEKVDSGSIVRWINEAINRKAKEIIVFHDTFEDSYHPHYLLDEEDAETIIQKLHGEEHSMVESKGIVDVEEEIRKAYNSGESGINYDKVWFSL
jgi:hypothetical protein